MDGLIEKEHDHVKQSYTNEKIERIFIFTLMWSIGALVELEDRQKLQTYMTGRDIFN